MTGHGAKFSRKKEEAIVALLIQRNVEEAAKSIGVSTQTLVWWMKLPEFQTRVPSGAPRCLRPGNRSFAAGDLRGRIYSSEDHGRYQFAGINPGAGRRQRARSRKAGNRDRGC